MIPTTSPQRPATRDRVMRAAKELFYSEGYGVSVDAIADHADVAKPTVYAHFASKEALLSAVLQSTADGWFADLEAEIERRANDPLSQLMAPFDLLVADLPDPAYHGCIIVNTAATFLAPEDPARRALLAHDQRMIEVFERLAAAVGAARPPDLARQLLLLFDGIKARGLVDHSGAAAGDARAAAAALAKQAAGGSAD